MSNNENQEPVLWILGAGANRHLDLPLLNDFDVFMRQVLRHPRNQGKDCETGRRNVRETLKLFPDADDNIEQLLAKYTAKTKEAMAARNAIRWCFEKRHDAVINKRDIPFKYSAYGYFLACVCRDDRIVTFNYDLMVERTIKNARRKCEEHVRQPRLASECINWCRDLDHDFCGVEQDSVRGRGNVPFRFVKIHGSLDWYEKEEEGKLRRVKDEKLPNGKTPFIVYPDVNKYENIDDLNSSCAGKLLRCAQECLKDVKTVIVAGYSFPESDSEKHPFVKTLIDEAKKLHVHIIDPNPSDRAKKFARDAAARWMWKRRFEEVFHADHVQVFARALGREPKLKEYTPRKARTRKH